MYIGDLEGNLKIDPRSVRIGTHTFMPGETNVVQIGDENDTHALWIMLRLIDVNSLLYLGIFQGDKGEMMVFERLINNERINYQG